MLSVNEALKQGIELDLSLFEKDFDFDKPGVIFYCKDEKDYDYPNIFADDKNNFVEDIGTDKKYCTILEWNYMDDTVNVVFDYIKKQMQKTTELELWNVELGGYNIPTTTKHYISKLDELTCEQIKEFYKKGEDYEEENYCFTIVKS